MHIIQKLDSPHIDQLHALYQQEWWTRGRTLEDTRKGVAGSQLSLGVIDNSGALAGFARILTDYVFKALVLDLIVREDLRGAGAGQLLMTSIQEHEALRQVKHFELYCLPEMQSYYERLGFSSELGGIVLMRRS